MKTRTIIFKYFFFIASAVTTFFAGCTKEDEPVNGDTPIAVSLNTQIQSLTRTTADGNTWIQGDEVGIYMLTANGMWPESFLTSAENKKYTVQNTTTGVLAPADGKDVYYPLSGDIDIVAYYPYGTPESHTGSDNQPLPYSISVNLSDQSNPAAIDLLYAKAKGISKGSTPVNLQFRHVFSRITLNVAAGDGFTDSDIEKLTAADVTISQCPAYLTVDIQNGDVSNNRSTSFPLYKNNPPLSDGSVIFSAIIPPGSRQDYPITFMMNGMDYHCTLTSDDRFLAGNNYVYPVTVSKTGVVADPPTITDWKTNDHGITDLTPVSM